MLRSVKNFHFSDIITRDGYIGNLDRLIVHEQTWHVLYFIVDGDEDFRGKKIIFASRYYEGFDWLSGAIKSNVDKRVIAQSPEIIHNIPKAKINEKSLIHKFGWHTTGEHYPDFVGIIANPPKKNPSIDGKQKSGEMMSTDELLGYEIRSMKQKLGFIDDLAIDEGDLSIKYIIAKPYPQISDRRLLISTDWVKTISWLRRMIFLTMPAHSVVESSIV